MDLYDLHGGASALSGRCDGKKKGTTFAHRGGRGVTTAYWLHGLLIYGLNSQLEREWLLELAKTVAGLH
jgi:anti-sigma factor RsiW